MSMTGKVTFVLQVECGSFGLLILAFFLSFLFLYLWVEVPKDYNDFDWWVSPQLIFFKCRLLKYTTARKSTCRHLDYS